MSLVHTLLFDDDAVEELVQRTTSFPWAAAALDKARGNCESVRTCLLTPELLPRAFEEGRTRFWQLFLELAVCHRLGGEWHADAIVSLLGGFRSMEDFVGRETGEGGYDYGGLEMSDMASNICIGLDLVPDLPDDLLRKLTDRILLPIADLLDITSHRGGSNWQARQNRALLSIGLTTGHEKYVDIVRNGPKRSWDYIVSESIRKDGFWFEQSVSYHCNAMENLLFTKMMADRHALGFGGDDMLRAMINAIARMALPGRQMPALSDSYCGLINDLNSELELAYCMYRVPWVGWVLGNSPRDNMNALLFGQQITVSEVPEVRSELFDDAGLCVFKTGEAADYWNGKGQGLTVLYGRHGDWHGHAGKLGVEYVHDQEYMLMERGVGHTYELPIHRNWYVATASHSTVVIDGKTQFHEWPSVHDRPEKDTDSGRLHAHIFASGINACTVSADFAYPDFDCRRTLFQTPLYLLDIFECAGRDGEMHTFDWLCHTQRSLIETDELTFTPCHLGFPGSAYDYIYSTEAADTDTDWLADVVRVVSSNSTPHRRGKLMRLIMLGQPGTRVFKGSCPTSVSGDYGTVVLVRRQAVATVFVSLIIPECLDLSRRSSERSRVALECLQFDNGRCVCRVTHPDNSCDVVVKQDRRENVEAVDGVTTDALLAFAQLSTEGNVVALETVQQS